MEFTAPCACPTASASAFITAEDEAKEAASSGVTLLGVEQARSRVTSILSPEMRRDSTLVEPAALAKQTIPQEPRPPFYWTERSVRPSIMALMIGTVTCAFEGFVIEPAGATPGKVNVG
jgi:hypothetical protein